MNRGEKKRTRGIEGGREAEKGRKTDYLKFQMPWIRALSERMNVGGLCVGETQTAQEATTEALLLPAFYFFFFFFFFFQRETEEMRFHFGQV